MLVRHPRVDVNGRNTDGNTPLLSAVKQLSFVRFNRAVLSLHDSTKVDVTLCDAKGQNPLWYAIAAHNEAVVDAISQRPNVDLGSDHAQKSHR